MRRRDFLKTIAAALASVPPAVRALTVGVNRRQAMSVNASSINISRLHSFDIIKRQVREGYRVGLTELLYGDSHG